MPYDHHAAASGEHPVNTPRPDHLVHERFMCPFAATPFVAGPENKHFAQLWIDLQVVASVDTCSMIHHHEYVTILLQGPKDGVTKALQKLARCLMNYNPHRDPHNEHYRGPNSRMQMRGPAPYRYQRQRSATLHRSHPNRASAVRRATPPLDGSDAAEEDGEITLHASEPDL